MRILIIISFLCNPALGQIIDSHSPDSTGMYFNSFDSLISILFEHNKMDRIHLRADESILTKFPDEHMGISILKMNNHKNIKSNRLKLGELLIDIGDIRILYDKISIRMRVFERLDKGLSFGHDGLYIFTYSYQSETKRYRLMELESGIKL